MSLQVNLSDKVALITGAGRGMGKAFALAFARQGARVAINDIEAAGLGAVADTIREKGGNEKFLDGIINGDLDSHGSVGQTRGAGGYGVVSGLGTCESHYGTDFFCRWGADHGVIAE